MALFKKKAKAKKRKILIAEDSDFQRSILKAIVESEPTFRVLEARDGEEAWKIIEKQRPDLVVLDVMMPKMNGLDVCLRMKNDTRYMGIPVMIVTASSKDTGKSDEYWRDRSRADDFITKPFKSVDIIRRINKLIEQYKAGAMSKRYRL